MNSPIPTNNPPTDARISDRPIVDSVSFRSRTSIVNLGATKPNAPKAIVSKAARILKFSIIRYT